MTVWTEPVMKTMTAQFDGTVRWGLRQEAERCGG
jgi:hypothetical protein